MKRKLFCILLSLCMLLCFMPQAAWADPDTAIKYYDWDANQKKLVEQTLPDTSATVTVTTTTTEWKSETASWYVVEGTVTINQRVTVTGNVNLLLKDNCNLTINGGISVPNGTSLTIYAQSNDDSTMGKLEADAEYNENCAGIGGGYFESSGTITINGGKIEATGHGQSGAGIGGGHYGDGTNITINGGIVTAYGMQGAGIGGGVGGDGTNITINGGTVTSTISGMAQAAAIGGGRDGNGTDITINGGTVTATVKMGGGAAIGGGCGNGVSNHGYGTRITISGGTVTARCSDVAVGGAGIGGGKNGKGSTITISGSVTLKVQGGKNNSDTIGTGAAIGNGGSTSASSTPINGTEVLPNTNGLTNSGSITYYKPGATDLNTENQITATNLQITFDLNGKGSFPVGTSSVYTTVAPTGGGIVPQPTDPTATGYTFGGWYTEADCTNQFDFSTLVNADKTLYAKWTADTYNITYTLDGGALSEGQTNPETYNIETSTFNLNNPTKAGYTFAGWTGTGLSGRTETVTISKGSTGARAYTANWTENSYTIKFNTAGGSTIGNKTGVKWTGKVLENITNPTKNGYTFDSWECGNTVVNANTTYADLAGSDTTMNITLTAQWTEKTGYTIKFTDAGDASDITNVAWTNVIKDKISSLTPTKAGYTFTGWKCGDSPVTDSTTYADLAKTDTTTSITLTAQWEDKTAPVISGIENGMTYYVGQEFTATDVNTVTVTINGTAVTQTEGKYKLTTTGENVIVATDSEKNATTLTVTVSRKYGGGGSKKSQTVTDEQKQAELEKAAAEKKAAEIAEVKTTTAELDSLKARSLRTAKGNVKVVAKLSSAEKAKVAEFKELGYTVKYRFYRSPKKSSGYKAMLTGTTGIYYNTYGEAGTRYYYKVQIRVYDADGALIAKTELKDCKYATRMF